MVIVGLKAQMIYWALGLGREYSDPRTNEWCLMDQAWNLMSKIRTEGWSKEKCLLG